jgi:hypothetical protein
MAIDRKLIQQVKEACVRIKRAGISLGMEKLAGPFRNQPVMPRRRQQQQYQAPQQQYQAPQQQAPAPQAPLGENAGPLPSYEGNQASSDSWKQAPAGMQRFRNSASGEVFYAPNGQVANQYTAGGDASSLGIKPGERAGSQASSPQQTVPEQAMARDQEMFSGPAAGLDSPGMSTPPSTVGNTGTQYDTFKGYDDQTGAHAPSYGSGMDAAIAESKRIRAADPRNTPATLPAPAETPAATGAKPYDRGIPFRKPPANPANPADAAAFTLGNMADQGGRVTLDAINSRPAKAIGQATGGMGPGGFNFNRNAPGR